MSEIHTTQERADNIHSYDGRKRAEATRTQQPVQRADWSTFAPDPLGATGTGQLSIVSIDPISGALVMATYVHEEPTTPVITRGKRIAIALRDAVEGVYWHNKSEPNVPLTGVIAFADKKSLRTAAKVLQKAKAPDVAYDSFSTAGRRLEFRTHLSFGFRFPIITDGLTHKFYTPNDTDDTNIHQWGNLFGLDAKTPDGLYRLFATAAESESRPHKIIRGIENNERNAISLSVYATAKAACKSYDATEQLLTHCEAIVALDPRLRERNVLQGTLTEMKFQSRKHSYVTVRINSTCNLRENSDVWVIDGKSNEVIESSVKSIGFVTDTLTGNLATPRSHGSSFLLYNEKSYKSLFVLAKPFFASAYTKAGNDWSAKDAGEQIEGREVPLAIALAGAPTL